MPFTDQMSSISGRNSRASNVSAATGASRSVRSPPAGGAPHDTMASAGVLSMLKTTTDTGDIGALSFNTSRLPTMPRSTHQRRTHTSKGPGSVLVSSQHSYAPSQTSRVSSQWDTQSTQRRGSFTSMQSMPPSLPPVHLAKSSSQMPSHGPENPRDSRSFSMTSAPTNVPLPRHRSANSLKSQGHEPRHGTRMPPGPIPPMPENRGPFVYPTRLKRPGYRSPSPALSDTYPYSSVPPVPPVPRRMAVPHPQQPYNTYGREYAGGYPQDPRYLNVRPPPRTMTSSPGGIGGYDAGQYGYTQNPAAPMPPMSMQHPIARPMPPHMQASMPLSPGAHPPPRSQYQGPQYGPRPGYSGYASPHYQGYHGHRGPPPSAVASSMAHSMFHDAARMARQLPHRTDTPLTEMGSPSSDPPSSGSAPNSSDPPTPKDQSSIQVTVDPAFIDPALVDLAESSSEPVLSAKYFEYAEGRPGDDTDIDVLHPSVPPSGFVQRVKAMLESKAAVDAAAAQRSAERDFQQSLMLAYGIEQLPGDSSELTDFHELAANETPRFTIIEEFDAPVELPASPVKVPELEASPVTHADSQVAQRITREMVKAELGPSSVDNTADLSAIGDTHRVIVELNQRQAEHRRAASGEQGRDQSDSASLAHSKPPSVTNGITVDASLPTGANLALHFSMPADSTTSSDETHTKDPFALDADTLTIQQQQSKKGSPKSDHLDDSIQTMDQSPDRKQTVSPIKPGEENISRCSAVSPVQEHTMGIDETIGLASSGKKNGAYPEEEPSLPGAFPEESLPPPTPRTPKTYSKSVSLQPSVTSTDTSMNRLSLPGDLSTMGETTMNTASDMVTDMAVRFSLPQTTITIGRPQVIDISTESTPVKPGHENAEPCKPSHNTVSNTAKRNSVTFADEVAPLNISKKQEPARSSHATTEAPSKKGKSIIRNQPTRENTGDSSRASRDSTTELRFQAPANAANNAPNRFGSTHLPGLKEESVEDMSLSDHKRSTDLGQFPLPARIAAAKAMQERRLQDTADKAKSRRAARHQSRPIAEIRDLPSLNFSRMDLIDKLNQALEVRETRSMDVIRRRDFSGIHCPSPQRPQSTEPLRERYMSFFSKPEDLDIFDDSVFNDDDATTDVLEPGEHNALVPTVHIHEGTQIDDDNGDEEQQQPTAERPLSPQEFLNVASQVNRLSIPSVAGLSDRLSELIPGLRNLQNLQIDSLLFSHEEGGSSALRSRPETALSNRSSAGFRTLAERAEEIVLNGTHDSIAPSRGLNKALPALPASVPADRVSAAALTSSYLSGSMSVPIDLGKTDPTRPSSALIRRAPTSAEEVHQLLPKESNPLIRNKRSLILSHRNTSRPWNLDANYPWTEKASVDVDLTVPSEAYTRGGGGGRGSKSLDLTAMRGEFTAGIDIGSLTDVGMLSVASVTTEQLTAVPANPARKQSKRSIIGSLTRKFGLTGGHTSRSAADEGDLTGLTSLRSPSTSNNNNNKKSCVSPTAGARESHNSHRPGDGTPPRASRHLRRSTSMRCGVISRIVAPSGQGRRVFGSG